MASASPVIMWFRNDLRLADNPALLAATDSEEPVIPLFVLDEEGEQQWKNGAASNWWLHHSLKALDEDLRSIGSRLLIRKGESEEQIAQLISETGAKAVYWNRRYEPTIIDRDTQIKKSLAEGGVKVRSFNGGLLQSPLKVANKSGSPYKVFTPFWKSIKDMDTRKVLSRPESLTAPSSWPEGRELKDLALLPELDWDAGFYPVWNPGEEGALKALKRFSKGPVKRYADDRDLPAKEGVSRLSPHLHFGELSPLQIWDELSRSDDADYLRQIVWREFAYHLLYHFRDTPEKPLREEFEAFPWKKDKGKLEAWQKGATGFPIVDAGMRELWNTGWMHNRVRMIAASFLVKHLLQPWQEGARWFWDTLVDADLANNTLGWQWVAGCGADAAPYFRIFNPITQGERFDSDGEYTKKWVPELKDMPSKYLFKPWEAPKDVLKKAGVELGENYPKPIVSHEDGRQAALDAYEEIKKSK